jgi:chromosome segregation ATPase
VNKRKVVSLIKVAGLVCFILGLSQIGSAQNNKPADERETLQQLLSEVRMLRESMQVVQRMSMDTYRSQLLADRIRVIRDDIHRLTTSINETRDTIARTRAAIPNSVDEQKLLEDQIKLEAGFSKRAALEMELKKSKDAVEMYASQVDRLVLREQEMSSELRTEQTKLDDLEARLNSLDRAMDADRERLEPDKPAPVRKP